MEGDIFFWWSIISTMVGLWQFLENRNKEEKIKAQVKVWQQNANGISQSLQRVVSDNLNGRYSTTNDVCNAVWAIQATAFSLYQSHYEERCVTEKEYKERQKRIADTIEKNQQTGLNLESFKK